MSDDAVLVTIMVDCLLSFRSRSLENPVVALWWHIHHETQTHTHTAHPDVSDGFVRHCHAEHSESIQGCVDFP